MSASLTQRFFLTVGKTNNSEVVKSHKTNHHAVAFYPALEMIRDMSTTPFLSIFDKQLFVENKEPDLMDLDIFLKDFIVDELQFGQILEFYKILSLLWSNKILQ